MSSVEVTQFYPEYATWLALCNAYGCKSYLEIGTEAGGSIMMAARMLTADQVVTVDISNYHFRHFHRRVRYVAADSHLASTRDLVLETLGTDKIDAVFVDGDHTYQGITSDFEVWWPVTRRFMGFHDIVTQNHQDVQRFWAEVSEHRPAVNLQIPRGQIPYQSCGIGILFKDGYLPSDALEDLFAYAGGKYHAV